MIDMGRFRERMKVPLRMHSVGEVGGTSWWGRQGDCGTAKMYKYLKPQKRMACPRGRVQSEAHWLPAES